MALKSRVAAAHSHPALRYVLTGIASFAVDFGLLFVCYSVLALPLWLSTSIGFWCSFVFNFLLTKHYSFRVPHGFGRQLVLYSLLVAANYLATVLIVSSAERVGVNYLLGKTAAVILLTFSTYQIYRRWIFVNPPTAASGAPTD